MSFWTFFWYLILAGAVLFLGGFVLLIIIGAASSAVTSGSDALHEARTGRAARKWARVEMELEDDDAQS
jgi:hypothetical protein